MTGKSVVKSLVLVGFFDSNTRIVPIMKTGTPKISNQKLITEAKKLSMIRISPIM